MVFGNGLTGDIGLQQALPTAQAQQVASNVITSDLPFRIVFYDSASHTTTATSASITDNLAPGRTQNFTYDTLNRIFTAKTFTTSGVRLLGSAVRL